MIRYLATLSGWKELYTIEEIEVEKETNCFFWTKQGKWHKNTQYQRLYDTKSEAIDGVKKYLENKEKETNEQIERLKKQLETIKNNYQLLEKESLK